MNKIRLEDFIRVLQELEKKNPHVKIQVQWNPEALKNQSEWLAQIC